MKILKNKLAIIVTILSIAFFPQLSCAQSQTSMNVKAYDDYQKSDKELNKVYQNILKSYASEASFIQKFRIAQRLWVQLRDAELASKYPEIGSYGSAAPMCESIYLERLTRDRIKFLNVWISGIEEGDICIGSVRSKQ